MKPSSREKLTPTQTRLNKTQQQPPPKNDHLDHTNYLPKKTTLHEKTQTEKPNTLPPRVGSSQKINYKIEQNMTHSKIKEAKQGLQLLKKKMSRNGMSRDKPQRGVSAEKRQQQFINPKRGQHKQEDYYGYEKEQKKHTPPVQKKSNEVAKKTVGSKTSFEEQPIKKQQPLQEDYYNQAEQVPLKSNQDFMAILQREMARENANKPKQQTSKIQYQIKQDEEIELVQCSKGCGRQFNVTTIAKHEKVCEKVFQSKRKIFNSAAHRQAEVEDFKQPPPPPTIRQEKVKPKQGKQKDEKIPKWKLQSAAFRAGIKQGKGQELSAQEKAMAEQASGMVQCPTCGRKFNQEAGKRHIAFCASKAKQMPKMNTSKKR